MLVFVSVGETDLTTSNSTLKDFVFHFDSNNKLVDLLLKMEAKTEAMSRERLRQLVHIILRRLLEAKVEAQRAVKRANDLQLELNAVAGNNTVSDNSGSPSPSLRSGDTTPATTGGTLDTTAGYTNPAADSPR